MPNAYSAVLFQAAVLSPVFSLVTAVIICHLLLDICQDYDVHATGQKTSILLSQVCYSGALSG